MSAGRFMQMCVCVCVCMLYKKREYKFCDFGLSIVFKDLKTNISLSVFQVSLICSTVDRFHYFSFFFMHEMWERKEK